MKSKDKSCNLAPPTVRAANLVRRVDAGCGSIINRNPLRRQGLRHTSLRASISLRACKYTCNRSSERAKIVSTTFRNADQQCAVMEEILTLRVAIVFLTGLPRISFRNTLLRLTSIIRESSSALPRNRPRVLNHDTRDLQSRLGAST